jgi:hypothetical protein
MCVVNGRLPSQVSNEAAGPGPIQAGTMKSAEIEGQLVAIEAIASRRAT